jgi:hypothetical protein
MKNTHHGHFDKSSRRFQRFRVNLPLVVTMLTENGYERVSGRCGEIAVAGLSALIPREIKPGELVSLELAIPHLNQNVSVRAVVRQRKGLSHGFEFISLQPQQRETISSLCHGTISG